MKRMLAWVIYVFGGVLALKSVVGGLTQDSLLGWFTGIAYGIALWWVAVGFGLRLGVTPSDFVASIKSALGFDPPPEIEETAVHETL